MTKIVAFLLKAFKFNNFKKEAFHKFFVRLIKGHFLNCIRNFQYIAKMVNYNLDFTQNN